MTSRIHVRFSNDLSGNLGGQEMDQEWTVLLKVIF